MNVTRADRLRLEAIVLDRSAPQKHVWRANIILATADGCGTAEIMRRSGKSKPVVWRWQARFMAEDGIAFNKHFDGDGMIVFQHACALGCEGIVSKRLGSHYRSGRVDHWLKIKNPAAPAVKREAEEDWG